MKHDPSFNLFLTKFGTKSFGMQLITQVADTLAMKPIFPHASFTRLYFLNLASAGVLRWSRAVTLYPQADIAQSSVLSGDCGLLLWLSPNCWMGSLGHQYVRQSLTSLVRRDCLAVWLSWLDPHWQHLSASAVCSQQKSDMSRHIQMLCPLSLCPRAHLKHAHWPGQWRWPVHHRHINGKHVEDL